MRFFIFYDLFIFKKIQNSLQCNIHEAEHKLSLVDQERWSVDVWCKPNLQTFYVKKHNTVKSHPVCDVEFHQK